MMMKLRLVALAAASAGIVAFAGCGNGIPQPRLSSVSAQHGFKMTRPEAGRSWMSPIAKRAPLLYVSVWDTGVVYVYSYPKAKLLGKLVGILDTPSGMCSDSKGNVWITNFHGEGLTEYAHGGTKPIATLSDPGTDPNGCSVDQTTGNLAVTGLVKSINGPSQPGAFAIYKKAKGSPTLYSVPFAVTSFCSYDDKGNLFVDGQGWGQEPRFALSELRKGKTSAEAITLNQTLYAPGAVQWYGQNLSVGDTATNMIYQFAIKAGSGTQAGSVGINFDSGGQMGQFWIDRSRVIVPTYIGPEPSVRIYTYPGGAGPVKTITGLEGPSGVTISLPPS